MKKYLMIVLIALLLTGCSNGNNNYGDYAETMFKSGSDLSSIQVGRIA